MAHLSSHIKAILTAQGGGFPDPYSIIYGKMGSGMGT